MQNQFLTESTTDTAYALPAVTQAELATVSAKGAQTTQAVHQWLTKIQRKTRRDKVKFWSFFILFESLCFSEVFGFSLMHYLRTYLSGMAAFVLLVLPMLGMGILGLRFLLKKPEWNAEELKRIGGVQAIGALIDLVFAPKLPNHRTPLYAALAELLPQMKASDARLLTAGQRKALHRALKSNFNPNVNPIVYLRFRLAILKALEQVGDAAAIPVVSHLANGKARTANQKALKAAAQECLPLLQSNHQTVEATKTLLRASQSEDARPDTLLRPASGAGQTSATELLRGTNAPNAPLSEGTA